MIGVCTGNVRSTPTPKLTLRTVNVSCRPGPLTTSHMALEHLDALTVALDHAHVDLEVVAGREVGDVAAERLLIDQVSGLHGALDSC